jgi:hypothetical protein
MNVNDTPASPTTRTNYLPPYVCSLITIAIALAPLTHPWPDGYKINISHHRQPAAIPTPQLVNERLCMMTEKAPIPMLPAVKRISTTPPTAEQIARGLSQYQDLKGCPRDSTSKDEQLEEKRAWPDLSFVVRATKGQLDKWMVHQFFDKSSGKSAYSDVQQLIPASTRVMKHLLVLEKVRDIFKKQTDQFSALPFGNQKQNIAPYIPNKNLLHHVSLPHNLSQSKNRPSEQGEKSIQTRADTLPTPRLLAESQEAKDIQAPLAELHAVLAQWHKQPAQRLTLPILLHDAVRTALGKDYNPYNIIMKFKGKAHLLMHNGYNRNSRTVNIKGLKSADGGERVRKIQQAALAFVKTTSQAKTTSPPGGNTEILYSVTNGLMLDAGQQTTSSAQQFDENSPRSICFECEHKIALLSPRIPQDPTNPHTCSIPIESAPYASKRSQGMNGTYFSIARIQHTLLCQQLKF